MPHAVLKNSELLRALSRLGAKERAALLKVIGDKEIHCICECVFNTLKGKVPLSTNQKRRLSRHKNTLRKLVKSGESLSKKRKLLMQKGGSLLPLILGPLVSGVLGSLFN